MHKRAFSTGVISCGSRPTGGDLFRWRDFLKEIKFPFPECDEKRPAETTNTSEEALNNVDERWRATFATKDDQLPHKLCTTLDHILGDSLLPEGARELILARMPPVFHNDYHWAINERESKSQSLLNQGFFPIARMVLSQYGSHKASILSEDRGLTNAIVNFVLQVEHENTLLIEAKSPSVMKQLGQQISDHLDLTLDGRRLTLMEKVTRKVSLYMGQRKMEWLFLTSYNHWIVYRLIGGIHQPYLVYSSSISIQDSAIPFRVFIGAALSVMQDVRVPPSPPANPKRVKTKIPKRMRKKT